MSKANKNRNQPLTPKPVRSGDLVRRFVLHQRNELDAARDKHPPINSVHEGYAVILEELDEFWDEVRKRKSERDPMRILEELVQIAAMAQRTAEDVLDTPNDRTERP